MRYVYRPDNNGNIKAIAASERIPFRGTPEEVTKSFHRLVLDAYKRVEADGTFQGAYAKKEMIKRVHETALARDTAKV